MTEREPFWFIRGAEEGHYRVRPADRGARPFIRIPSGKHRLSEPAERVYTYEGAVEMAGTMIAGLHRRTPPYLRACIIEVRQADGSWEDVYWAYGPLNRYGRPQVKPITEES